ncbi:MAG: MFS transporter [Arthrobacter sp.]|uniref:MFS transporter n=1 Tax=Arthrobacter sp. TaxID=1667 RepID=UPI003475D870
MTGPTGRTVRESSAATGRSAAPPGLAVWRNAVFTIFGLSGLGFATWVSRIPAVRDGMELSTSTIGYMLFGLAAGSLLGLAAAPSYLARLGSRRGLFVALLAMASCTAGLGAAAGLLASLPLTVVALCLFGFAFSVCDVVMNMEGALVERAAGKTLMPLMHAFFSIGTVAGAVLGAAAAAASVPVAAHFAALGLAVAVAGAASARRIPVPVGPGGAARSGAPDGHPAPADGNPTSKRGGRRAVVSRFGSAALLARDPRLLLLGLMVVGMAFAEGSANDWLALAAVDGHGMGNAGGALVYGAFVAAMTLGRVAGGPLIDRHGRPVVLVAMAAVGVAGIAAFILTDEPWVAFAAAVLWGLGGSLGFPVGISVAADHPTDAARRVSMVSIFGYSAFLVGPPVLGFFGEAWGILAAFYLVAAMLAVSLAATPAALRPPRGVRGRG